VGRNPFYDIISQHAPYRFSTQASIWHTESFLSLLKAGETGWQAEIEGTRRASHMVEKGFLACKKPVITYPHNTVLKKGKWTQDGWDLIRREGMDKYKYRERGIFKR
jgi:hypothetical protein